MSETEKIAKTSETETKFEKEMKTEKIKTLSPALVSERYEILDTPLEKYLAKRSANALAKLNLNTVNDLLSHIPFRLAKKGELLPIEKVTVGQTVTVVARVLETNIRQMRARRGYILNVIITDSAHNLELTFFAKNIRPLQFHAAKLASGTIATFSGTISEYRGVLQLQHPDYEIITDESAVDEVAITAPVPIYHASAKLPSWQLARAVATILPLVNAQNFPEILPSAYLETHGLPARAPALRSLHQPRTEDEWENAYLRMVHQEAFVLQTLLGLRSLQAKNRIVAPAPVVPNRALAYFDRQIPFQLTAGQENVGREISADLAKNMPMRRLLQGDVGTGKTIVALRAMLQVIDSGRQAVLLAPTEVLAEQHYAAITAILGDLAATDKSAMSKMLNSAVKNFSLKSQDSEPILQDAQLISQNYQAISHDYRDVQNNRDGLNNQDRWGNQDNQDQQGNQDKQNQQENNVVPKINVALLTGALSMAEKKRIYLQMASGQAQIIIGTHSLLEDKVQLPFLNLVVVDEQHRFGVNQRDKLAKNAHLLVMSATPIPRTIAMTVFGDLKVSTLRELPKGRKPISTTLVPAWNELWMKRIWQRASEEIENDGRVYVVCPRIFANSDPDSDSDSDSDLNLNLNSNPENISSNISSVEEVASFLSNNPVLAKAKIAILHGKMSAIEKAQVMADFQSGKANLLVTTTVIEVGVDVPEATMMVILDAQRFGMAQLHQLRGRIGRGTRESICLAVHHAAKGTLTLERLEIFASTNDGFLLAEEDTRLRNAGNVLGKEQSGTQSALKFLNVVQDSEIIETAKKSALELLEKDPALKNHPELAKMVTAIALQQETEYLEKS